uniref:Uncharacterized protein n=1 Tax=Mola mola TaxID=94237 RepID=A0A3Q3W1C0_MOLML
MEDISHFSLAGTQPTPGGKTTSQNWEFLVAVIVSAISISLFIALLAKWHVVRRYLASYRHTRLRETDTVINPHCMSPVTEEDDDGFIEDNYIPACERARAERAAENMEDTEEEIDEIELAIA